MPRRWRTDYLTLSSLLLMVATLGPGYALTMLILCVCGHVLVRTCGRPGRLTIGVVVCTLVYTGFIVWPQPPFLPPSRTPTLREPLYFYLHWAGLGYLFLKTVHVLVDVGQQKMTVPPLRAYLAYLLFAPTVRMGPLYRYPHFADQLAEVACTGETPVRRHTGQRPVPHSRPRLPGGAWSREAGESQLAVSQATRRLTGDRDFGAAAIRIVFGLVRLGVMAALLGIFPIDPLFNAPETLPPGRLLGCLYAAPISIYLWISGYLDISVGMGLLMGFRVPENFQYPWRATSLADFWRRWHITLGAWLRDYLYIPLGGNRRRVFLNYFITFLLCGVWHGLYLSYAIWGVSQGIGLAVDRMWGLYWKRHRDGNSLLYQRLERWRLVASPLNASAAWALTFHFQILTIAWFMDEEHAGKRMLGRLLQVATAGW